MFWMGTKKWAMFVVLVILAAGRLPLAAQTGGLTGMCKDERGNPYIRHTIQLEHEQRVYRTKTNMEGRYMYIGLAVGNYKVSLIDSDGHEVYHFDNVNVGIGDPTVRDFDMAKERAAQAEEANSNPATQNASQQQMAQTEGQNQAMGLKQLFDQGVALEGEKKYADAAAMFEKAVPLAKGSNLVVVEQRLAESYAGAQQYDKAVVTYQKLIALDPDHAGLWKALSGIYAQRSKTPQAEAGPAHAQERPLTRDQVLNLVRNGLGDETGAKVVEERKIDFEPTDAFLSELRQAGAAEAFLKAVRGAAPLPTPTPGPLSKNPKDGLNYVWIPPGTFVMGCSPGDSECGDNEKPSHQVTIGRGFWLGQTPVTVAAYRRYSDATGKAMPRAPNFNPGWNDQEMPIVNASWDDATAYCTWAGGRLPTEAEWEYAARAGSTDARYGPIDEIAWYASNSGEKTREVALKRANAWNLFDMLGNVTEWVNDWYGETYYLASPERDPQGPDMGDQLKSAIPGSAPPCRALRGAGWPNSHVRVSQREGIPLGFSSVGTGFRCVGNLVGNMVQPGSAANQASAVGALRTFNTAEVTYASIYTHGFSPDLKSLGRASGTPSESNAGLIDPTLTSGTRNGYKFLYTPGPKDSSGTITTYSIVARPVEFGRTGHNSYYTDQSCVIRSTDEDRAASRDDPPLGD